MLRRLSLALLSVGLIGRAAAAVPGDLGSSLADLLRQLDYDQSRKLTRQIEPAQSVFTGSDLHAAVAALGATPAQVLVVVGRRGDRTESPVEVQQTFSISRDELARAVGALEPKVRGRNAYVPRSGPDARWRALLANAEPAQTADAHRVRQALAMPGGAVFLFVMQAPQSVQKVVIVPDTVKISVSGSRTEPPARPAPPPQMPTDYSAPPEPESPDAGEPDVAEPPEVPASPEPVEPATEPAEEPDDSAE